MEMIFLVVNGDLEEVKRELEHGARVKMIQPVSQVVSTSSEYGDRGNVCAYVVLEK